MSTLPGVELDDEVVVRLPADLLRALDRFIGEQESRETRAQAMVSALREWAHDKGYASDAGEVGIRPEDLSAENDG